MVIKFLNFLTWPSFALVCPLYASIRAIENNTHSNYQQCLTYWVLFSIAAILESMLAKLLKWIPFWPWAKGIATLLLVVPYFHSAACIYMHFIRPYVYGNSLVCNLLQIPKTKACGFLNEQNNTLDAAESYMKETGEEELEKVVIYEGVSESNHDNIKSDVKWTASPKKVQKEWSCALCLVSTTSKKCLEKHFQGKKHKNKKAELEKEEHGRNEVVANQTIGFAMEKADRISLGNLNQIKWVNNNLHKLSILLSPVSRSIRWCKWTKPEFGWTKLNADGSIDRYSASFGGLLRDHKGDPICAYVSKAPSDNIFLVELWAIWRGLVLSLGLGIKVIWVESDSMGVVKNINKGQPYGPRASGCFKQIWQLLKKFDEYKVTHSWRETNRAADHLAKLDLPGSDVILWPADFPNSLHNIIKEDAEGRWYRRG